jgi:hypothetical protein
MVRIFIFLINLKLKFTIVFTSVHYWRQPATYFEISEDDHPWMVSHAPSIFDEL